MNNQPLKLSPRDAVRLRPGMYIGGTDKNALHHMAYVALDHVAEEAFIGNCNAIQVVLLDDTKLRIGCNCVCLPVEHDPGTGLSKAELILSRSNITKAHFTGRSYPITGGLHGLGLFAVNALSSWLGIEIAADGYLWQQTYGTAEPQTPLEKKRPLAADESAWTWISFIPDFTILETNKFDLLLLQKRCRQLAYQCMGTRITLRDERVTPSRQWVYVAEEGLASWVRDVVTSARLLHSPVHVRTEVEVMQSDKLPFTVGVEAAFAFTDGQELLQQSYVNTVQTVDGGTHLFALRSGIVKGLHLTSGVRFSWDELEPGLAAIIGLRHPKPQFMSPTKVRLDDPDIQEVISDLIARMFAEYLRDEPDTLHRIVQRVSANR
jgi:DNA gyrase subunit B